jgi:hypothetical protein
MDHKTFAKQCDETMAAINKLTASYHRSVRRSTGRARVRAPREATLYAATARTASAAE